MKKILLLAVILLGLAGCATTTRYVPYTDQRFPAKGKYDSIAIYNEAQHPPADKAFRTIGRVEVSGYLSNGVDQDMLSDEAKRIAREKGADAIINAQSEAWRSGRDYVEPGYMRYHYYYPVSHIYYEDMLMVFKGELIVFIPAPAK